MTKYVQRKAKSRPQNESVLSAARNIDLQNISTETKNSIHFIDISHCLAHSKMKTKKIEKKKQINPYESNGKSSENKCHERPSA